MYNPSPARRGIAFSLAFTALCVLVLASCKGADDIRPHLDATPELFGAPTFGIVNQSFVRAYAAPDAESAMTALFRGGDIVSVLDRSAQQIRYMNDWNYWYKVRSGERECWVFGADLELSDRELNAKTIARKITADLFGD